MDHLGGCQARDGVPEGLIPTRSLEHTPRLESQRTARQAVTVDGKFLPVAVGSPGLGLSHGQVSSSRDE